MSAQRIGCKTIFHVGDKYFRFDNRFLYTVSTFEKVKGRPKVRKRQKQNRKPEPIPTPNPKRWLM